MALNLYGVVIGSHYKGLGWVRLFGWGIVWTRNPPSFSEREGFRPRHFRVGPWRCRFLARGRS